MLTNYVPMKHISRHLLREVAAVAFLSGHENIVSICEIRTCNDYIPLHVCLDELRDFDKYVVVHALIDVVAYMQSLSIMHRDIRPSSVLVKRSKCRNSDVKLSEWGSSTLYIDGRTYTTAIGTLQYRAPEILNENSNYDCKIDLWSLGCTIYEIFNGHKLFNNNTRNGVRKSLETHLYILKVKCSLYHNFILSLLKVDASDRLILTYDGALPKLQDFCTLDALPFDHKNELQLLASEFNVRNSYALCSVFHMLNEYLRVASQPVSRIDLRELFSVALQIFLKMDDRLPIPDCLACISFDTSLDFIKKIKYSMLSRNHTSFCIESMFFYYLKGISLKDAMQYSGVYCDELISCALIP